ncbi:MAG TPA: hypothetical protein VGH15_00510 [Caulobacteraceae bacterium]
MQSRHHLSVVCYPRHWLSRLPGECAFPVDGDGPHLRSCCNPCMAASPYCRGHRRRMKGPEAPPIEELEAELRELGI